MRAIAALDTVDRSEFVYLARFSSGFVFERSLTVFKTGLAPTQLMPLWICCFAKLRRRAAIRAENFPFRIPGGLRGQIQLVQDRTRRRIARQLLGLHEIQGHRFLTGMGEEDSYRSAGTVGKHLANAPIRLLRMLYAIAFLVLHGISLMSRRA